VQVGRGRLPLLLHHQLGRLLDLSARLLQPVTRKHDVSVPASINFWARNQRRNRRCPESVKAGAAWSRHTYPDAGDRLLVRLQHGSPAATQVRAPRRISLGDAANSGRAVLLQGQGHITEPGTGDLNPFPAVGRLGCCRNVSQSGVQLRQFQAPLSSRVEVPAIDGFVQEPFSFAVMIRSVHSVLFGRRLLRPGRRPEAYIGLTPPGGQRFTVPQLWAWYAARCRRLREPGRR
jgi:hypothetical protein